jgi:2-polyprenyl-6-methoxyphenol hydroxylase-like FAD-dependent oxidoreductase
VFDCDVLIVGAGPVGLTLAIDLGQRGVDVLLIEKNEQALQWPKMERCNARTMELFRHLGLADRIRAASRFTDVPMDVFAVTGLDEEPLACLQYPSVTEAKRIIADCTDCSLPAEPYQLISQYTLEPLLRGIAEQLPTVKVRFESELKGIGQDADGVTAEIAGAGSTRLRARYLVGTDGGNSTVRKLLGISLEGEGHITTLRQIFFRSEQLLDSIGIGPGRHYWFPEATMVVQDDLQHFGIHTTSLQDETAEQVVRSLVGAKVDLEILNETLWRQNLLLAQQYGQGRVFLCGDSAHLVIPNGGLGLNTGIGDAVDLGWKLAGTLQGWAGPKLLPSYQAERRPVGVRNREASGRAARAVLRWRMQYTPLIHEPTEAGLAARRKFGEIADRCLTLGYGLDGIECGYQYLDSPIIFAQPGSGPLQLDFKYEPSLSPGFRLPHAWLGAGESVQDRMQPGYNILDLGNSAADVAALQQAFGELGVPVAGHRLDCPALRSLSHQSLLIIRPDLHIAWAGVAAPTEPLELVKRITGHQIATEARHT